MGKIVRYSKVPLAISFIGALFNLPYGLYELFRTAATILFIVYGLNTYSKENEGWAIFWFGSAVLINPLFKIVLSKELWKLLDIVWAIILFYRNKNFINKTINNFKTSYRNSDFARGVQKLKSTSSNYLFYIERGMSIIIFIIGITPILVLSILPFYKIFVSGFDTITNKITSISDIISYLAILLMFALPAFFGLFFATDNSQSISTYFYERNYWKFNQSFHKNSFSKSVLITLAKLLVVGSIAVIIYSYFDFQNMLA